MITHSYRLTTWWVGILLALIVCAAAPAYANEIGQYTPVDCPETIANLPALVECGEVTVPLFHEDPTRGTIRLGVFRLPSTSSNPAPDPLVMLQGGPGGSVEILVVVGTLFNSLYAERDLVFIEQRGNRYSTPALTCDTYSRLLAEAYQQNLDAEAYLAAEREAINLCLAEFAAAGIDLSAFDSYENARDIPMVVLDALGYEAYNLYGVSYGSLLAQHVMEIAPRGLRSVILDAVVPRDVDFNTEAINFGWRSFALLADACAADETCNTQAPNLESTLLDLIERLDAQPADITITNPATGETFDVKLNGSRLAIAVFNSLYTTPGLRALPTQLTTTTQDGSFDWAAQTLSSLIDSANLSMGMNLAVNCSEREYTSAEQPIDPNVPVVFAQALLMEQPDLPAVCNLLNVPRLPEEALTPASAPIPTLLLSGEFDPITPPVYGERVVQTLPQALHVTFPGVAHGAVLSGLPCPLRIVDTFLQTASTDLDTTCTATMRLNFARMVDLTEYAIGSVTFLGPEGWAEIEKGVYTDLETNFLLVDVVEGQVLDERIDEFLNEISDGLSSGAAEIVSRETLPLGDFAWEVLRVNVNAADLGIVFIGTQSDTETFLFLVQAALPDVDGLVEGLVFPMLQSFTVVE